MSENVATTEGRALGARLAAFCGLPEAKLLLAANAPVEQLVASRTKNPDHVPLHVGDDTPRAISAVFRFVRNLKYTRFSACLTGCRQVWAPAAHSIEYGILALPLRFVKRAALFIFAARPYTPEFAGGFDRALYRAIPLICVGRRDVKVLSASAAQSTLLRRSFVFVAAHPTCALSTIIAAPFLIWANGLKWPGAKSTVQIVHGNIMP